jgi:peptide/nickel transport system permease protein
MSLASGAALGAFAGWAGGWPDRVVGRLVDTIMAFPLFVLAVGIAAGLGNSVSSVIIATAIVNLPFYARQTRSDVNRQRGAAYVEAAGLAGFSPLAIVALHIMPNVAPPLMVQSSLNMGWAILNAAGLSFIGLGVRPPQPEWGIMVSDGAANIFSGEWWMFVFPGAALMLAILTFSLVGDALRDFLDPKRR